MKYLIFVFIVLVLTVFFGTYLAKSSGSVLITYGDWSIQTHFWVAVICLIVFLIIGYGLLRLLSKLMHLPQDMKRWKQASDATKNTVLIHEGLGLLMQGRWKEAEQTLVKATKLNTSEPISFVLAAMAAFYQQNAQRAETYLRKIKKTNLPKETPVFIILAMLHMSQAHWKQALSILETVQQQFPKQPSTPVLLSNIYMQLGYWTPLQKILPTLKNNPMITHVSLTALERKTYVNLLEQPQDKATLLDTWHTLPKQYRQDRACVRPFVRQMILYGDAKVSLSLIEKNLKTQWDHHLVQSYTMIRSTDAMKQLKQAEAWLNQYPHQAELLLCVGSLSMAAGFPGKAYEYLNASIRQQPTANAYYLLAQLYEKEGKTHNAMLCLQKGMALSIKRSNNDS